MFTRWLVLFCLLAASPAYAVVDWTDSFEYANDAAMRAVWFPSQSDCTHGGPTPSTERPFTGSKSDKQTFRGAAGFDPGAGGCFSTRDLNGRADQMYSKFWMYMQNFTVNSVGTKITRHEDTVPGYPGVWWSMPFGNNVLAANIEGVILDNGTLGTQQVFGGTIPHNTWVCVETYLAMGTPGVDNGIVRAWINGVQVINKTNQRMRSATLNQQNGPNVKFGRAKLYTQHGLGVIFYDDYAVSRDARIGCDGVSIPSDTTNPSTPTLSVSVSGTTASLTGAISTDNVAVASYQDLRCTGAGCTPTAVQITTQHPASGTTVNSTDTGLTASTTYGYCRRAVDTSGRTSPCSSPIQYITTGSVFFNPLFFDPFTRADAASLGANYTGGFTGNANFSVVSNQVRVGALSSDSLNVYNGTTPDNQYVKVQLVAVGGAGIVAPGLLVRAQAGPAVNAYECRAPMPSTARIAKFTNGSGATLATNNISAWVWTALDTPMCEAEGTALRMYAIQSGIKTLLASTTDATYTSGKAGIIHHVQNTGGNTLATSQLDNLEVGEISVSQATPPSITGLTATATTITVTNGPTAPTSYRVHYGSNTTGSFYNEIHPSSDFPGGVFTHSMPAGTQYACIVPRDVTGNEYSQLCLGPGFLNTILNPVDTDPATFSLPFPTSERPAGTTSAVYGVTVSKGNTNCRSDLTDIDYDAMDTEGTAVQMSVVNNICSDTLTGLTDGSSTTRYIASQFINSNEQTLNSTTRQAITIAVAAAPGDTTVPDDVINLVATPIPDSTDITFNWAAALNAAFYRLYIAGGDCSVYQLSGQPVTTTSTVRTLAPTTQYCAKVEAVASSGFASANFSNIETKTTFSIPDREPPSVMKGLRLVGRFANAGLFVWNTGIDGQGPVDSALEYCIGEGCTDFIPLGPKTSDSEAVRDLPADAFIRVRGIHYDKAGNPSGGLDNITYSSPIVEFTTLTSGIGSQRPDIVFGAERGEVSSDRPIVPGGERADRPQE